MLTLRQDLRCGLRMLLKNSCFRLIAAVTLTFVIATNDARAQESPAGDWAGGAKLAKESPVFIKLRFEPTKTGLSGFFHSPGWRIIGRRFSRVSFDGHNLRFEFPSQEPGKVYIGDGQLKDGVITGRIQSGEEQSSFHLVRLPEIPGKLYERYVGSYQLAP